MRRTTAKRPHGPWPGWPGPAPAWPGGSDAERAPDRGHRAPRAHGGATGAGSPAASSGQGLRVEYRCGEWKAPGKEGVGGAHRGSRSPARQFWQWRSDGVPMMAAALMIDGGQLGLL
jgi:hypothetical protein